MTTRRRSLVIGRTGLAAACILVMHAVGAGAQQAVTLIAPPEHWVPMEYWYDVTTPGGVTRYVARQTSDGSLRRETIGHDEVQILNLATKKFYALRNSVWNEHPSRPQTRLQLTTQMATPVPATDPRVSTIANTVGIPVSFYEWAPGPEQRKIFSPELNMLEVWSSTLPGTDRALTRQVTSVLLGEPRVELTPPAGAAVQVHEQADGPGVVPGDEMTRLRNRLQQSQQ